MFRFPGFSTPSPAPAPAAPPPNQQPPAPAGGQGEEAAEEAPRVSTQHARTSAAGFDPAPLERGVRALEKLKQSPDAKKVGFVQASRAFLGGYFTPFVLRRDSDCRLC